MLDGNVFKLSKPHGAYLIQGDQPIYHWIDDDAEIVELINTLHNKNQSLSDEVVDLRLICQRQADFMKREGYSFKDFLDSMKHEESLKSEIEHSCSICFFMYYRDNDGELDCIHPYATPENGAPENYSCEPNTCPYFEEKNNNGGVNKG